MDEFLKSLVTVAVALIGVAIIAVLVSKNANTSGVISSLTTGFSTDLRAATGPVTSANSSPYSFSGITGGSPINSVYS